MIQVENLTVARLIAHGWSKQLKAIEHLEDWKEEGCHDVNIRYSDDDQHRVRVDINLLIDTLKTQCVRDERRLIELGVEISREGEE